MAACALRTAQQEQLLRHQPGTRGGGPGVLGGAAGLCWLYENGDLFQSPQEAKSSTK